MSNGVPESLFHRDPDRGARRASRRAPASAARPPLARSRDGWFFCLIGHPIERSLVNTVGLGALPLCALGHWCLSDVCASETHDSTLYHFSLSIVAYAIYRQPRAPNPPRPFLLAGASSSPAIAAGGGGRGSGTGHVRRLHRALPARHELCPPRSKLGRVLVVVPPARNEAELKPSFVTRAGGHTNLQVVLLRRFHLKVAARPRVELCKHILHRHQLSARPRWHLELPLFGVPWLARIDDLQNPANLRRRETVRVARTKAKSVIEAHLHSHAGWAPCTSEWPGVLVYCD
jgi:hypothetical protein